MFKKMFFALLPLTLVFTSAGCSNSTDPVTAGSISLSAKYQQTALGKTANVDGIDSIKITKAICLLKEIKFKTQQDSTDCLYKTSPFLFELNLTGTVQSIDALTVPFGTYNRLEFNIHKAEAADTLSMTAEQKVKIRPFFSGTNRYSVIIEGKIYSGGVSNDFVYKSDMNAKQKIDLASPLLVSENAPSFNVTMLISSAGWFSYNSSLLNPGDIINTAKIDNNIRQSIHAVKDNNKDGSAD